MSQGVEAYLWGFVVGWICRMIYAKFWPAPADLDHHWEDAD